MKLLSLFYFLNITSNKKFYTLLLAVLISLFLFYRQKKQKKKLKLERIFAHRKAKSLWVLQEAEAELSFLLNVAYLKYKDRQAEIDKLAKKKLLTDEFLNQVL